MLTHAGKNKSLQYERDDDGAERHSRRAGCLRGRVLVHLVVPDRHVQLRASCRPLGLYLLSPDHSARLVFVSRETPGIHPPYLGLMSNNLCTELI